MALVAALSRFVRNTAAAAAACLALAGAASPASAQPPFWVIKDADSTIYLLGTIHVLKPETVWRSPRLDAAFNEATELWLELATTNPETMRTEMRDLVSRFGLSPANPLSNDLLPTEMATLDEAARLAGVTGSQLNVYRPWFAAFTISNAATAHAGYDAASGVDSKVEALFRARGIAPKGLETAAQQIRIFASLTRPQEIEFLRQTMEEYERAPVELDRMVKQWASADIPGMEALFVTEMKTEEPDLYQTLLVDRNADWAEQIAEMLKGAGVIFIAVGAGHLVGPDSVLAQLKAMGIDSARVQ